jgi:exosome complex RNA-binding protein Rrp42 (RNase PH superfamily)
VGDINPKKISRKLKKKIREREREERDFRDIYIKKG